MEFIIEMILSYISIWMPSIVSILGVCFAIVKSIGATRDKIAELKEDQDFKEVKIKLEEAIAQNKILQEQNKIAIDKVAQIKGYVDQKLKEKENDKEIS